jgi:hypothetical protein
MQRTISVSQPVYDLLRQWAQQAQTTPDLLAEKVLREHLGQEEQAWRRAFETLIARVQARTAQFSSAEIETDITAAAVEAQELRRARRRAD